MSLIILGAGGHGQVVAECAQAAGFSLLGFLDQNAQLTDQTVLGLPVVGADAVIADPNFMCDGVVVGIGNNATRLHLAQRCLQAQRRLPVIMHPRSWVSPSAQCGHGTVVMANATVQTHCQLGLACIINTNASIDHDCVLGDGVHIAPGAHVAGQVTIGHRSHIGIGATVVEGIRIGADCLIAAGAVVIRDVPDGQRVAGVPAQKMK